MATLLRWLGRGSPTHNASATPTTSFGKKRSFLDLTGNDENEPQSTKVDKRVKRAFVDMSRDDDGEEDCIAVAHHPPGELNPNQLTNRDGELSEEEYGELSEEEYGELSEEEYGELSEEEYANKLQKKLWVKPAQLAPDFVAEYSKSPATKTPAGSAREPIQQTPKRSWFSADKSKLASLGRQKSKTLKTPAKTSKTPAKTARASASASKSTDLRTMFGLSAPSSHIPKASEVVVYDDDIQGTPPPQLATASLLSQRRSGRAALKSYANMDLDDSADELGAPSPPNVKRKSKFKDDDDDDFIVKESAEDVAASELEEEADLAFDLGETSSDSASNGEDGEEEEEEPRSKSAKRNQTKANAKNVDDLGQPKGTSKKSRLRMVNLKSGNAEAKKINYALPPLSNIEDIFLDITTKALKLGLGKVAKGLNSRLVRVATMCSGTESPLLALEMIRDCLAKTDDLDIKIEHLFSAEIVPFKQAYIERNFNPPIIFRDITELTSVVDEEDPEATTAYGGKAPVPKNVDMVIAGTSCVDFSGLNSHQKDLDDGGESADTWNAVLSYCRAFRPAIVLLENVSGADWDRMLADYENIDYECSGAMVNTRDYYIPQVRERGYMACFNTQSPGYTPRSAEKWVELMEKFKRPASSPVSDFLIPNDQIVRAHIRTDEPTRDFDWAQCEITQMEYRQDMRLGWARPITHWKESGSKLPPDNGNAAWYHKQVERVLDTIDGAVLRKALDMYDCRFKTRIFDLSQNIYRETDHRPFGISGCITPSGIYFVTDLGRVVTSEETLKLQGIPLEKISFTTEQPSEIQSLAGNAMSSTVIAASILSALIPGYRSIDACIEHRGPLNKQPQHAPKDRQVVNNLVERVQVPITNSSLDLSDLLEKAELATRRCYCEGSTALAERPIQQCQDCGHTTCTSCGGNPAHNVRQNHIMSKDRLSPAKFKDYARSVMPLQVSLSSFRPSQLKEIWPSAKFGEAATTALGSVFALSTVRRTHCWTITYTSDNATLDLVISPGNAICPAQAQWRLYATPCKDLPGNSPLRRMMSQPIAKSRALDRSSSLNASGWLLRVPESKPKALSMTITGSGCEVASWWSRMEMPDFVNHKVKSVLNINVEGNSEIAVTVGGEYEYLPNCGKACNSLYKKAGGDQPLFLFLDPTRTGEQQDDCFVFSTSIDILEKDEVRPIVARVAPTWRPWATNSKSEVAAEVHTQLLLDESLHQLPGCTLAARDMELEITRSLEHVNSAQCTELAVLLTCKVPLIIVEAEKQVISANNAQFFNAHAWVFEAMRRHLPGTEWHPFHNHSNARCESCAPSRPALRWGLSEDGKELKPYEDPRAAALYERAIKARPEPIEIVVAPQDGGSTLTILLDVATIAHRAGARLPQDLDASYQWRFVTGAQVEFKPKPFKLRDTRGVPPYSNSTDLRMSIQLFPQQLMSLAWMKQQEQGVPFVLEEGEEASLGSLGWRAEVRATATKTIRGGICADHPGFGKTITSLALIHSEWRELGSAGILDEIKPRANSFIAHPGTLIVCPSSLLDQWVDEIRNIIGDQGLCVLKTVSDLAKHTASGFKAFKIVLVNRLLFSSDTYIERVAAFAAIPGPTATKGRPFAQWLTFAHEQIPVHLEVMERDPKGFKSHIEKLYRDRVNSEDFKAAVPSKRLTGADYIAGKAKKIASKTKVKAHAHLPATHLGKPLLEMFYWNRIIVDEFHQPEAKAANVAVAAMKADKRWGLSATPAIGDFYEVSRMAELIGVPLRIGSARLGVMKSASVKELRKDMTSFELFDAMRQIPSDSMHDRIHETHQQFLDTFVRQNIMDHDQLPCQQHLAPVALDLDHRALVAELSQHLNSADMRIKKKNSKATDRDKRFNDAVSTSASAEEALSKVAAFSHRGTATGSNADELDLSAVMQSRQAAVDVILRKLPVALSEAKGTEAAFGNWAKSRLEDGTLGDSETSAQILELAKAAKGIKVSAAELKRRAKGNDYGIGKRALTAYLNGLCNRLLAEKRSARYMQNLYGLQQAARSGGSVDSTCDNPGCSTPFTSVDVAVSALCGHTICRTCYKQRKQSESILCPGEGCSSSMADHHLFWPSKVGDLCTATRYGAKIDAAMKLLDEIKAKDEQAILFVQFANQLDEVEMALEDHGHGHGAIIVKTAEKAGPQIEAFRKSAGTKQQSTVLVLNSSDETAAGFNLQNANHVIFLSPLLKDTAYGYDSTMAQTIGRVRRHGQKKKIYIYRIVALCTVDVDILEQRERRNDALVEQDAPEVERPDGLTQTTAAKERTQLVRDNGKFSLRPQSWLVMAGSEQEQAREDAQRVKGRHRVLGWEDFSSLVKFSKNFTEDDD